MLVLDTNVFSEILRPEPNEVVVTWFESQPRHQLFTTSITQAEILYGIALLPKGGRRQSLLGAAKLIFEEDLENRVLAFDSQAAAYFAEIGASRFLAGAPISQMDAMIAAITRLYGAKLVTRNIADFGDCGLEVINPWDE